MNDDRKRVLVAVGVTVLLFLSIQLGALALLEPFDEAGRQAVDDPANPTNSIVYFGIILVATGFMLAAFKFDLQWLIRGLIIAVSVMLAWYVLSEFVPPVVTVGSTNALAAAAAVGVGAALYFYPEWYVIDGAGALIGAGAGALFGISFGLLPALLLLTVLAVYDAISVYGTEHMLDLAEGVMDLKIPVVLVVPTTLSYTYLDPDSTAETLEDGGNDAASGSGSGSDSASDSRAQTDADDDEERNIDRDALFIGLGDAVIPTILVASAAFFLEAGTISVPFIALNWAALGALAGTLAGLLVLLYMVLKGRAHAGLPLLNGGAIGGYLLGALASGVSIVTAIGL
ncbi:presenilin family intramembrane aspartyl protease PSH [Halopiger thermotolerans]